MAKISSQLKDGERVGEAFLIGSMRESIEKGHTYTEWVHDFNGKKGVDTEVLEDGSIRLTGKRFRMNSAHSQIWETLHEMQTTSAPFTGEEKRILQTSEAKKEVALSNEEILSIYEGKTQPMDLITSEQSNLLSNMVLDKSPEAISRFRLLSGGLNQGMSFASIMVLQKMYESDGFNKKDADEMTGGTIGIASKVPQIYGKTIAATGGLKKIATLGKEIAAATVIDAPLYAGAFRASDEAVDATDKILQKLKIDDQNRIRTDSMAGASAFDLSVQSGKLGLGKAGSRLGYKIFEGAAEKGGIKLLSSTLKASEIGYLLGTALDVGVESYELVQQWQQHKDVSSDQIGKAALDVMDPSQMGDEAIDAVLPDGFKKPVKGVYDWFAWTFFGPARAMAEGAKFVTSGIAHSLGAKTDEEKQDEFNRIAHKSVMALKDTEIDWKRYKSADSITRKALTADEFSWMKNNYGLGFFNQLEKAHHEIWFKTSRIMTNRQRAFQQMKDNVFVDDDLMNKIKGSDKGFYTTLQDYTKEHVELKKETKLKGKSYVNFVTSKQDLNSFVSDSAKAANYTSASDYYYDVIHKTNIKKQEEQKKSSAVTTPIPNRGPLRDSLVPDRNRLRQQFGP